MKWMGILAILGVMTAAFGSVYRRFTGRHQTYRRYKSDRRQWWAG